ncbi:DedA family protein [Defluviimonas sp. SAOS-178_SWC]|uniref:DedA family protein n=1 Tax=Defluviimonas sp. SAOS-178_SWC TaxID=3121287 RepID=UPI0032215898
MTDWLLSLVPQYGLWLLAATTFLSCLALPVPSSMMMLAAGGFAASGDLGLVSTIAAALFGAVIGDQAGFAAGRAGGPGLLSRLGRKPSRAKALDRARAILDRRGDVAIFLTRWLFSPVGPWANFAAGAGGLRWLRFTLWSIAGEAVWVALYIGMGHAFAGNLEAAGDLLSSGLGLVGGLAAMLGLGLWLKASLRDHAH